MKIRIITSVTTICPFFLWWLQLVCPGQMRAGFSPACGYICNISYGGFKTAFWGVGRIEVVWQMLVRQIISPTL